MTVHASPPRDAAVRLDTLWLSCDVVLMQMLPELKSLPQFTWLSSFLGSEMVHARSKPSASARGSTKRGTTSSYRSLSLSLRESILMARYWVHFVGRKIHPISSRDHTDGDGSDGFDYRECLGPKIVRVKINVLTQRNFSSTVSTILRCARSDGYRNTASHRTIRTVVLCDFP